jgi:hypothetical protein
VPASGDAVDHSLPEGESVSVETHDEQAMPRESGEGTAQTGAANTDGDPSKYSAPAPTEVDAVVPEEFPSGVDTCEVTDRAEERLPRKSKLEIAPGPGGEWLSDSPGLGLSEVLGVTAVEAPCGEGELHELSDEGCIDGIVRRVGGGPPEDEGSLRMCGEESSGEWASAHSVGTLTDHMVSPFAVRPMEQDGAHDSCEEEVILIDASTGATVLT